MINDLLTLPERMLYSSPPQIGPDGKPVVPLSKRIENISRQIAVASTLAAIPAALAVHYGASNPARRQELMDVLTYITSALQTPAMMYSMRNFPQTPIDSLRAMGLASAGPLLLQLAKRFV